MPNISNDTQPAAATRPWTRIAVRSRIAFLLMIYAALTAAIIAIALHYLREEAIDSGKKLVSAFAQLVEEQTDRTIEDVAQTLNIAGERLEASLRSGKASEEVIRAEFLELLPGHPFVRAIWVLDSRGRILYDSDTGNIGIDLSDREYFVRHRQQPGAGFYVGVPVRSHSTGTWFVPATREWRLQSGDLSGILVAAINPLYFDRVWGLDKSYDLAIGLFRDDGILLMRTPFDDKAMGVSFAKGPTFSQLEKASTAGMLEIKSSIDTERRLVAYRRLAGHPSLVVVVGQSMRRVLEGWWRVAWVAALGWSAALAVVWIFAARFVRELEARKTVEDRYRILFESNPYSVVVIDRATRRFLAANDATVKQYGWTQKELLAMTSDDVYPPEDLPAVRNLRGDGTDNEERQIAGLRHRRKDGSIINVELAVRPIELAGKPAVITIVQDVTRRVQAELDREIVEGKLRQGQKMEAVGQLTGGVAHDFNNILMVIMAKVEALEEDDRLNPDVLDEVKGIGTAAQRAADLTRQLLAFSRKQPLRPQHTNINDLVTTTGKLLRRTLGEHVELESILADDLWNVEVDRAQLEAALVNLCLNARDAMPNGGQLLIETQNTALDGDYVGQNPDAVAGDHVLLAVTDTGSGIAPDLLGKVFEPFFTTKAVGKGTGLGLSMVYGFIKQSKGHISIYSEVGRGTTIKIYLPKSLVEKEQINHPEHLEIPRGHERILVVEDDTLVRASVVRQLQSLGYAVTEAAYGEAGLAAILGAPAPIDLVLTDIVMPGKLGGKGLADEVSRRWPSTKVVFMSGYTENAVVHNGRMTPVCACSASRSARLTLPGSFVKPWTDQYVAVRWSATIAGASVGIPAEALWRSAARPSTHSKHAELRSEFISHLNDVEEAY